jgi:hypothetical protein
MSSCNPTGHPRAVTPKLAPGEETDQLSIDERPGTRHSGNGIYEMSPPQFALRPLFARGYGGRTEERALHALRIDRLL